MDTPNDLSPVPAMNLDEGLARLIEATDPDLIARLAADPAAYLDLIALTNNVRSHSDGLVSASILAARHAGCTWEQIGAALGTSRQAAHQAYAGQITEPPAGANLTGERRLLRPLTAFTEMDVLNRAGRYGWHCVDYGVAFHVVERDDHQWEHARTNFGKPPYGEGWEQVGRGWFFWTYWARRLDIPALPGDPSTAELMSGV